MRIEYFALLFSRSQIAFACQCGNAVSFQLEMKTDESENLGCDNVPLFRVDETRNSNFPSSYYFQLIKDTFAEIEFDR